MHRRIVSWIGVELCVVPAAGAEQSNVFNFEWEIVGKTNELYAWISVLVTEVVVEVAAFPMDILRYSGLLLQKLELVNCRNNFCGFWWDECLRKCCVLV